MTTDDVTKHPRYAEVLAMKNAAEADEEYDSYCFLVSEITPKHKIFWVEMDQALMPGHIYSQAGRDEYRISGMCEFDFDLMFLEEDDEDDDELPDDLSYEEMYGERS